VRPRRAAPEALEWKDVPKHGLIARIRLARRQAKWALYREHFEPRRGELVLDVGVSRFDDNPGENYFLKRYPFPEQLTGVGISDLSSIRERYPKIRLLEADGRALPFADDMFDIVHSNATVEHVGPRDEQARFIRELIRVAKAGFITTPNRWFPIEPHVRLPLVHWLPRPATVALLRRLGRLGPAAEWPVWLLSKQAFRELAPPGTECAVLTQRIGGWPAVFVLIFRKPG
jgi:methyltransferase family protein